MTKLKKIPLASDYDPFLIPIDLAETKKIKIVEVLGFHESEFNGIKSERFRCTVEILGDLPKEKSYSAYNLKDVVKRIESKRRTWSMNNTTFNHLIETLGDNDEKWKDQKVEVEIVTQPVNGVRTEVIYAVGAL